MKEGEPLPSVRALAKELRISALTVKKAYDDLEQAGFVRTVHGKGSFVSSACQELFLEQQKQEVENLLEQDVYKRQAFEKIRIEAPYHALTNAGHISYVAVSYTHLNYILPIVMK